MSGTTIAGRLFRVDELGVIAALVTLVLVIGAFHPPLLEWAQLVAGQTINVDGGSAKH